MTEAPSNTPRGDRFLRRMRFYQRHRTAAMVTAVLAWWVVLEPLILLLVFAIAGHGQPSIPVLVGLSICMLGLAYGLASVSIHIVESFIDARLWMLVLCREINRDIRSEEDR